MEIVICPACGKEARRIKEDIFTCDDCKGVWLSKGYTDREKAQDENKRRCPICDIPVNKADGGIRDYESPYGGNPKPRYFHYDCWSEYLDERKKQNEQLEKDIAFQESVIAIECPNCHTDGGIICVPEGQNDEMWICSECNQVIDEEWLENKVKEIEEGR